ncbi:MAG TPA: biotin--[acetyl-CoA-carboxylase] ligase [Aggregatilineales bacterium]|nr:biotin--[acetyl-CoA-carboxylase] ligase [Aggregatilineales bacterium]
MANDASNKLLDDARLREALGARPFRFAVQVGSTNDIARDWALNGAPTGAVVLTEEQIAGRGRFGRVWTAPPGSALLMSIILRPRITPQNVGRLTMVGAVAVAEGLENLSEQIKRPPQMVTLKWPNDVLLAGRKVAGILPEAIWQGQALSAVIVGIGLNVSVDFTGTGLEDQAISVETGVRVPVDRLALLDAILHRVDFWAARAMDSSLLDAWRTRLETLGKRIVAQSAAGEIGGQAVDVDEDGALLVRADDGTMQRIVAGEVTLTGEHH